MYGPGGRRPGPQGSTPRAHRCESVKGSGPHGGSCLRPDPTALCPRCGVGLLLLRSRARKDQGCPPPSPPLSTLLASSCPFGRDLPGEGCFKGSRGSILITTAGCPTADGRPRGRPEVLRGILRVVSCSLVLTGEARPPPPGTAGCPGPWFRYSLWRMNSGARPGVSVRPVELGERHPQTHFRRRTRLLWSPGTAGHEARRGCWAALGPEPSDRGPGPCPGPRPQVLPPTQMTG